MTVLLIISFIYFLLGITAMVLTIYTHNNLFTKFIVRSFKSPKEFNKFLFYYWAIPIGAVLLILMIFSGTQLISF